MSTQSASAERVTPTLQAAWVEQIHARLLARYGSAWTAKWQGIDPAIIRADWARELATYQAFERAWLER